jgi:hypothetical protein
MPTRWPYCVAHQKTLLHVGNGALPALGDLQHSAGQHILHSSCWRRDTHQVHILCTVCCVLSLKSTPHFSAKFPVQQVTKYHRPG